MFTPRRLTMTAVLLAATASAALAGSPRLFQLAPAGGQIGTSIDVEFRGRHLHEPRQVLFYEPGISVESLTVANSTYDANGKEVPVEEGTLVRARLKIAPDCAPGPHGLRLFTAEGLTEYRRFFVSPYPIVNEVELPPGPTGKRNNTPETAMPINRNVTIHGRLNFDPADVDVYRVEMKKGERLSTEIEGARLGIDRGLSDLHLTILDPDGNTLAAVDDSALFLQDPLASIVAEKDGPYYVAVRHCMYNGSGEQYRLHVGTFARPTGIYPAGGPAGQPLQVQVLGDPLGGWTQTVSLPTEPGDLPFLAVDPKTQLPAPSPNTLRVSPFPNVLEQEPNDNPSSLSGSAVSLPVAFNGIIQKPGDIDCFRFTAKKGETYRFHALAMALGSPLDPAIWIQPVGKGPIQRASDCRPNELGLPPTGGLNRMTLDPILTFTAPADGEYILGIQDERGEGGPDYVYRIEAQLDDNAVYTYIAPEPENIFQPQVRQSISVASGNRYTTQFGIVSTSRPFPGDLELVGLNLPPGVTLHAPKITPGMSRFPVVFEVAPGTPAHAYLLDVAVRPVNGDAKLVSGYRQTIVANQYGNNDFYQHVPVSKLALAVTEPVKFSLEVEPPSSALVQNGELQLKFKVHREAGFDQPVTVQLEWRPNGLSTSVPVTIPGDKSEGTYLIGAARNASPGTYFLTLTAMSGGARQSFLEQTNRSYVASRPFTLRIAEPHLEARINRASVERGKTAVIVCKINHLQKFEGKAQATLARLPRGVILKDPIKEFTSEDKEISFTIEATQEALLGNYRGIVMDVTIMDRGQSVRQLSGDGLLRIDAERRVSAQK